MSLSAHGSRQRGARRRLLLLAGGLLAACGAVVSLLVWGPGSSDGEPAAEPSTSAPAPKPSKTPVDASDIKVLPKPKRVEAGVPVGYPHTTAGAISAAAHYTDVLDILSPDAFERQTRIMAAPDRRDAYAKDAQAGARDLRKEMGLSPDGNADGGTYMVQQTRAFQIISASPDRVRLWLLVDNNLSVKGVSGDTSTSVDPAQLVWAEGDWKLTDVGEVGEVGTWPEAVTPGSLEAEQAGWRNVAYAQ